MQIDEGHYGDVRLDGLRFGWTAGWPGPVHEGDGEIQLIIDENTDAEQREAIRRIVYNEDSDELLTHYSIFHAMCTKVHPPVVAPIELEFDMVRRTARARISSIAFMEIEPVRNPVTGAEHRAQIVLPNGFGCTLMETASGSVETTGAVPLRFTDSFGAFARIHMTDKGIVRD